ncbi:p-aminobenzoyl-glutamate hydrolase subunit B [Brevundimonas sp. SH203]|uniref:amidohydrolase n=1 Tax=Brevundimonas sp. SH203 TaxID=345167 RepID=UPI0009D15547|nr:amidohydrolase [Brevundimonas sp. SH203]GAW40617.1 p-aminobenzoyl-glutamate hydrolase subunit B [Brevundimonas sp. SH203]
MKPVSMRALALAAALAGFGLPAAAAELSPQARAQILSTVERNEPALDHAALEIWKFAELGYQETQSTALLQGQLRDAGFTVTPGIAGEPTAFLARYKTGDGPVIAVLAEYDALPGLSQTLSPVQQSAGAPAGHGCGHNLFGAASVQAAIAVKDWMAANNIKGELRVYGTPAEEGGSGKVYMVRDGLFDDVDVAVHWHPGDVNSARQGDTMANVSGKFRFYGTAAHAAAAPDKGRSALDAVEAMNAMVNLMREHVPDRTRIHYVITDGGRAPNVVPAYAESYYYVRHTDPQIVRDVLERVKKAADGAALGTGTRVEFEAIGGVYSMLPNEALMTVMDRNLHAVGGISWTPEEVALATEIQKTLASRPPLSSVGEIEPAVIGGDFGGSTDVSDVSWVTPTVGLSTATFVPGSAGHSWQNVVAAGSSIGLKGAHLAAKTLALTTAELFQSPETVAAAKTEFERRRGPDFHYRALLGDRAPALNYRD